MAPEVTRTSSGPTPRPRAWYRRAILLYIADPTAEAIRGLGLDRVGLLGTRFTMEEAFYLGRLRDRHGLFDTTRLHAVRAAERALAPVRP